MLRIKEQRKTRYNKNKINKGINKMSKNKIKTRMRKTVRTNNNNNNNKMIKIQNMILLITMRVKRWHLWLISYIYINKDSQVDPLIKNIQ